MKSNRFKHVLKVTFVVSIFVALVGPRAIASPCDADVDKFCGDVQPGHGSIAGCLQSQEANLSFQCRDWLKKIDASLRKIGNACVSSAREYCRDVRPGYGRVKGCLMNNFDKLPKDCQDALKAH